MQSELEVRLFPNGEIAVHFHEDGKCCVKAVTTTILIYLLAARHYIRVKEGRDG